MLRLGFALATSALLCSSCFGGERGYMLRMTQGRVPCSKDDIEIVGRDGDGWTARCHGRNYYCAMGMDRAVVCSGASAGGES
jgi:hypothetical protein